MEMNSGTPGFSHSFSSKLTYDKGIADMEASKGLYIDNTDDDIPDVIKGEEKKIIGILSVSDIESMVKEKGFHQNLMTVLMIDPSDEYGQRIIYEYTSHKTFRETITGSSLLTNITPEALQKIISGFVSGLNWLHSQNLYHGNLKIRTTRFLGNSEGVGIIKMGEYQKSMNKSTADMVKQDWIDFGQLLLDLSITTELQNYTNLTELKELGKFLTSGYSNLQGIEAVIIGSSAFLNTEERPFFFCEAVRYLLKKGRRRIQICDDWLKNDGFPQQWDVIIANMKNNEELWDMLKKNAVPPAGTAIHRICVTIKNLINHSKQNAQQKILVDSIGSNPSEIIEYFMRKQPELVCMVDIAAVKLGFRFAKVKRHLGCGPYFLKAIR